MSGELILIQCKHWKAFKVGVAPVRELLGVVTSRRAQKGILVTSGVFTGEAKTFAHPNSQIELVDGNMLLELIRDVQVNHSAEVGTVKDIRETQSVPLLPPNCPSCGTGMALRTARKGANAGTQFWGCPRYPNCRGTRDHVVN
jgi:restriction system protein